MALRAALSALAAGALALGGCRERPPQPPPPAPTPAAQLEVGAVEDAAKWAASPQQKMRLARDAGFGAIVLSAVWTREASVAEDLPPLRRAVRAAVATGIRPVLAVYSFSSQTPITSSERAAFASYAAALVAALPAVREVFAGNEPNTNLFWLPQFDATGADVAAVQYELLLAETYDAVKAVAPEVSVVGGSLAPRGGDDPDAPRLTHSPTAFIRDLGAAYRASGRARPLMDAFSIHPYGESSSIPPDFPHPQSSSLGIADYERLVALLSEAFDGTAQRGSALPVVYGEYGIDSIVPPGRLGGYSGSEPPSVHPVDEATQGRWYARAIRLAACQPTVRALFLFHVSDEPQLERLQTGVRYADDEPKASLPVVRRAIARDSACAR